MNDLSQPRADIYRTITDSIIEAIKAGAGTFTMPWHGGGVAIAKPENALTRMEYHGVNVLMLWARAQGQGYQSGYWASYRQWQRLGAQVEKGERATPIVFYKKIENEKGDEEESSTRLFARSSFVFNAAQVTGWTPPEDRFPKGDAEIAEQVAGFVARTKADIVWGGVSAHYHIPTDRIHMPDRDRFRDTENGSAEHGLAGTLLHEICHWSGSKNRLARFGDSLHRDDIPFEELIAEIGAAFLCSDLGVPASSRPDHAAYVAHWLTALEGDSKAIFRAARSATQAAQYLHGLVSTDP
jgi:antirestriction protein ArdC